MRNLQLLAAAAAALVLAGCGGGGSGSSNTSTSTPTTGTTTTVPSTAHIEAIVTHLTSYDSVTLSSGQTIQWLYQDPSTIQSLDQVTFQLVYYNAAGTRIVLPCDQWTSSDTNQSYGALAYNSGTFQAANAVTPSPQVASAVYNNKVYSVSYSVVPRQVRERGYIQSDVSPHTGLSGVEVDFYGFSNLQDDTPWAISGPYQDQAEVASGSSGTYYEYTYPTTQNQSSLVFLGRATTQQDGTFRGSVPSGTYGFTLANSTLPSGYQHQRVFRYRGQLYNTGDTTPYGLAPLPTPQPIVTPPTTQLATPLPDPVPTSELPLLSNYYPNGEYLLAFCLNQYPTPSTINSNPVTNGVIQLLPDSETGVTKPTY